MDFDICLTVWDLEKNLFPKKGVYLCAQLINEIHQIEGIIQWQENTFSQDVSDFHFIGPLCCEKRPFETYLDEVKKKVEVIYGWNSIL